MEEGYPYLATRSAGVRNFKLKKFQPKEKEEQAALVAWLLVNKILFYAIPNGEKRDVVTAVNLKRQGVSPGVPDLCLPIARKGRHGLYIELKRRDGGMVSVSQREWLEKLNANGYLAVVARGWDQAREIIENYLDKK